MRTFIMFSSITISIIFIIVLRNINLIKDDLSFILGYSFAISSVYVTFHYLRMFKDTFKKK